jgi:hypothetical protein
MGRIALFGQDAEVLSQVAGLGKTYVEIGTLFGGSAIVAGISGCEVYCIDPLDGYYASKWGIKKRPDHRTGLVPTADIVRSNWANAGLDPKKLHIFQQLHPPWPEEIKDMHFDSGLIDGDHRYDGVLADYLGMGPRVTYLMFHDINKIDVQKVYAHALRDGKWAQYPIAPGTVTRMGVLTRCSL